MKTLLRAWHRLVCKVFGHKKFRGSVRSIGVKACMRCERITDQLTVRRPVSKGDAERRVAASLPEGWKFICINWKKNTLHVIDANGNKRITSYNGGRQLAA